MDRRTSHWWSLPSYDDREETRIATTIYLVCAAGVISTLGAAIAREILRGAPMGMLGLGGLLTLLVCMVAVKRGYVHFGAHLLITFGILSVLGFLYLPPYDYRPGAWVEIQLIVNLILAVMVLPLRAGFFWTIMNLSVMLGWDLGLIGREGFAKASAQAILSVPVTVVAVVVVYLATYQMRRAMRTAQEGELALQGSYQELEAQIELREQAEASYRTLVEQAPLGVAVIDREGVCLRANAAIARIFGLPSTEVIVGRNMLASGAELSKSMRDSLDACFDQGEQVVIEHSFRTAWGKNVDVRIHSAPILGSTEDVKQIVSIVEDISEKRSLEAQLIQSQKMEAIGRLAGGIAHDFNNYLTVMLGNAEYLALGLNQDSAMRASVEEIAQAASQSAALVRQLLAFSRKGVVTPQVIEVNSVFENLHGMFVRIVGESVELHESLTRDPATVHIDPVQLEQILFNLVVNARDAMPNGGTLALETENVHLEGFDASLRPEIPPGEYVRICVRDSGIGIPEAIRDQIFEPFFTTKEEMHGTGIGLSTVYAIVASSGGAVSLRSQVGEGTSLYVYLPWVPIEDVEAQVEPTKLIPSRGHERVLIIEDEQSLRMLVRTHLERAGYGVIEASSGQDALDRVRTEEGPIDIVLTDVRMPGMGGFEFAEAFAQLRPGVPVIFMSGYVEATPGGGNSLSEDAYFLPKPFTSTDLLTKLREVLDTA